MFFDEDLYGAEEAADFENFDGAAFMEEDEEEEEPDLTEVYDFGAPAEAGHGGGTAAGSGPDGPRDGDGGGPAGSPAASTSRMAPSTSGGSQRRRRGSRGSGSGGGSGTKPRWRSGHIPAPPSFDGNIEQEPFCLRHYRRALTRWVTITKEYPPANEQALRALDALTGDAALELEEVEDSRYNTEHGISTLLADLEISFGEKELFRKGGLIREFESLVRMQGESVNAFVRRFRLMERKLKDAQLPQYPEETRAVKLLDGLKLEERATAQLLLAAGNKWEQLNWQNPNQAQSDEQWQDPEYEWGTPAYEDEDPDEEQPDLEAMSTHGKILAPAVAPLHAMPCRLMLAVCSMMMSGWVEHEVNFAYDQEIENIFDKVDEKEENFTVTEDFGLKAGKDWRLLSMWPGLHFQLKNGLTESTESGLRWMGTTYEESLAWIGTMLGEEPGIGCLGGERRDQGSCNLTTAEDWNLEPCDCLCPVAEDWYLSWQEVEDWSLDLEYHGGRSLQDVEYNWNYSMDFVEAVDYDGMVFGSLVALLLFDPYRLMFCGVTLLLLCVRANALQIQEENERMKRESKLRLGHLSCRRNRKWNGKLRERFQCRMQIKAVIFLSLWSSGNAMDADQTRQILARMMQMTEAATHAAQASSAMMERFENRKKEGGNFGEASKVLKSPEVLEGDDPLKYVSWQEQFTNWLIYGDHRFADLLRDVENLDEPCQLSDFASDEVKEMAHKLYSILASYIRGPALQLVRAEAAEKNGFLVLWQNLKNLYQPKARPRSMAIGQAIMNLPSFPRERGMLENLLQLDLLLEQYKLSSGHEMPDDLVVSTVLRCLDSNTRRHLEMTLDDTISYEKLKDRLVVMDKNVRVWSGDSYLKMVQSSMTQSSGGPVPMEVDQVGQIKGKQKGKRKGKDKKGGGWFPFGYGGKQGGKTFKGKGKKGKGKKGGKKGKSKYGGNGKGKGSGQDRNTCRICGQSGEASKSLDDNEVLVVRVVLKLNDDFWTHYGLRAWRTTKDGNPMKFCYETKNFVDGQLMWNLNWWPLRSTLIRKMDDAWELVEHCNRYYTQEEPDAEIPECCGMETQTLTILHRKKEPIAFFGSVIGEQTVTAGGTQVDSNDFQFSSEPGVPFELQEQQKVTSEEVDQQDGEGDPWSGPIPMFENKESLVVNHAELNEKSPLMALREAAEFLGVGRGGSKNALWTRINQEVQKMEHKELFTTANRLFREQNKHKGLVPVHVPRQPSAEERELHELTHIPFQDWCDFCLACKSRVDPQRPLDGSEAGRRSADDVEEWPTVELEEDIDEGHPPEVSPEELKIIEEAAGQEEIERLLKMKVLEDPTEEELEKGSILTTRSVYDWRVREKRWKRRPGEKRYWKLSKCLPGQRDAAAKWFEFLTAHLIEWGFQNHMSLPSLFRHEHRELAAVCHVDDLIIAGKVERLEWLSEAMKKKFVISESGILPTDHQAEDEAVRCLKKRHFFTGAGVVIMPHEKYIPNLLQLYQLDKRAGKATPESGQENLEGSPDEILEGADQFRFRSALGTLLYISQDRVDIQHAVRNLSQFMARPTQRAESEVKHVILYLKRTEGYGLLLPHCNYRSKKAEILGQVEDEGREDLLEVFSDSDWAGDKSSANRRRHSVSSVFLFLNGCLVTSWSRSQKSIALSSCEAEFLVSAGGVAEAIQVKDLWQFLSRRPVLIKAVTDSSSCRAFAERLGVGRLKHIDIKYLWMQLEIKKDTMVMEGIPTLLNIGTKRLTRQRREFLMYLIGIMEMNAEGKEETFSKVGEDTFHQELEKKMLAKQMKEVKKQMIQTVVEEKSSWGLKIPTALVRAVTLLLLQQKVGGEQVEEVADGKAPEETYSWWCMIKMVTIYSIFVFLYGVYCGYRYRVKWSVYLRTFLRFLRQEETMEFQRQQDEFAEIGMIMRARLAANRGEWNLVRRGRNLPAPLQRPEGEVPENERPEEEMTTSVERSRPEEPSPVAEDADESEPDEEMSDGGGETELQQRTAGHIITDWDPMTGTLADYRVLQAEDEAFSGEEYFMGNPVSGYHRYYKPTASEREDPSFVNDAAPPSYMDVDEPQPVENYNEAAEDPNNRSAFEPPPVDGDWWDFETLFKYMKLHEARRGTQGSTRVGSWIV
eukprot:g15900.t1